VARDEADQRLHRDQRGNEAHPEADREREEVRAAEERAVLHHLISARREHDRHGEEERELGGGLAREAEDHAAHDRGSGARRSGDERDALREADLQRVLPRHRVDGRHARRAVALVPGLDREDREGAHDERDRHAHRVEEVRLDRRLEGEAHDRRGQEGHEEVRREALLHRVEAMPEKAFAKRARYSQHTARIAPSWITMSKTLPFSSFAPSRSETMIR
jgi:hypothetical protein